MRTLFLLLALCASASATTYYIDYGAANDSANGTSTSTPWKLCPGMQGFGGSYGHAIGDQFIFKGGVTWPTAVFPLVIANSGTAANNDYYGSSASYYDGGSWTRPLFDLNYTAVSSAGNTGSAVWLTGSNLTIYGLEIKGLLVNNSTNFSGFGVCSISGTSTSWDITVQNCFIHNWRSGCPTAVLPWEIYATDSTFGGIYFAGSSGYGRVLQCTIGWGEPPQHASLAGLCSGGAVSGGAGVIISNTFVGCPQFTDGGASVIGDNIFRNGTNSYDPLNHANAVYNSIYNTGGRFYIYNNRFHDLDTTFQAMLLKGGMAGATNTAYYVFNNVLWNLGTGGINLDEDGIDHAGSGTRYYIWNNTVQYNPAVGVISREQAFHADLVDCRNNHWISDTNSSGNTNPIATDASSPGTSFANPGTLIDQNNLWHSSAQAAAASYNIANSWSPTSSGSPTVGYGQNLTSTNLYLTDILLVPRPSSGAWDSGAYEFAAPVGATAAAITLGSGITLGAGMTIR